LISQTIKVKVARKDVGFLYHVLKLVRYIYVYAIYVFFFILIYYVAMLCQEESMRVSCLNLYNCI